MALCAEGSSILYVCRERQLEIRPLTISHGANSLRTDKTRFQLEFDWTGTNDPTAYLCVPTAIAFMGSLLSGGWKELMQRNHHLALAARQILCEAWGVQPPCPEEMIGTMAVVPAHTTLEGQDFLSVHDQLFDKFGIQVQVVPWHESPRLLIRISAQIYNRLEQYEYLANALNKISKS